MNDRDTVCQCGQPAKASWNRCPKCGRELAMVLPSGVRVVFDAGMRPGEVLALKGDEVQWWTMN